MKHFLTLLLFLLVFMGCEEDTSLIFEPMTFGNKTCENCALIEIDIPKAIGNKSIDEVVNTALREEIISILKYDDEIDVSTIDSAILSFQKEYDKLKSKFPEESTKWEATVKGTVTFENNQILTIRLDYYLFTGGAHGYSSIRYLNFDKTKGKELGNKELFKDMEAFKNLAESKFREEEKIPMTSSINSTGFMFENDTFYLPENIGFTQEGLQLFYEQYEVASYADGPIVLVLPYQEIKKYLPQVFF